MLHFGRKFAAHLISPILRPSLADGLVLLCLPYCAPLLTPVLKAY